MGEWITSPGAVFKLGVFSQLSQLGPSVPVSHPLPHWALSLLKWSRGKLRFVPCRLRLFTSSSWKYFLKLQLLPFRPPICPTQAAGNHCNRSTPTPSHSLHFSLRVLLSLPTKCLLHLFSPLHPTDSSLVWASSLTWPSVLTIIPLSAFAPVWIIRPSHCSHKRDLSRTQIFFSINFF